MWSLDRQPISTTAHRVQLPVVCIASGDEKAVVVRPTLIVLNRLHSLATISVFYFVIEVLLTITCVFHGRWYNLSTSILTKIEL